MPGKSDGATAERLGKAQRHVRMGVGERWVQV